MLFVDRTDLRSIAAFALAAALFTSTAAAAEPRTWRDVTGKFEIQATLLRVESNKAYLRRADGNEVAVPVDRLSQADRDYLAALPKAAPAATPAKLPDGVPLILVMQKNSAGNALVSGLVYHVQDGQAYVIVQNRFEGYLNDQKLYRLKSDGTFTGVWDSKDKRLKVPLEVVAVKKAGGYWILRGPAKDLPPPITKSEMKLADNAAIILASLRIDLASQSFVLEAHPSKVVRAERNSDGVAEKISADLTNLRLDLRADSCLLVYNAEGKFFGYSCENGEKESYLYPTISTQIVPVPATFPWHAMEVGKAMMVPVSGDEEKVVWQAVVEFSDPSGEVTKPYLTGDNSAYLQFRADGMKEEKQTFRAALSPGSPPQEALEALRRVGIELRPPFLVGQFESKNNGRKHYAYFADLNYDKVAASRQPKATLLKKLVIGFSSEDLIRTGAKGIPLDIPGFDGLPPNRPQPVKVEGGYKITSKRSMPLVAITGVAPTNPPKPEKINQNLMENLQSSEGYDAFDPGIPSNTIEANDMERVRFAQTPDGKWIYLISARNVLYKIDGEKYVATATLTLPGYTRDLVLSKSGLIVSFYRMGKIWQINANTLEVMREYPLAGASSLAASPNSNYGIATTEPLNNNAHFDPQFHLLDLEKGVVVHTVKSMYDGFPLDTPVGTALPATEPYGDLTMTADGKYFFWDGDFLRRYRLENSDIIFEDISEEIKNGNIFNCSISSDGKFVTLPIMERGRCVAASLRNGMNLKQEIKKVEGEVEPSAFGFDLKSGQVFFAGRKHAWLMTNAGKGIMHFDLNHPNESANVLRAMPDPRGDRHTVATTNGFLIIDFKPGRLKKP